MRKIIKYIRNFLIMPIIINVICITGAMAAGLLKPMNGSDSDDYMKYHHVNVTTNNGFVQTEVDQVFINKGS